MLQRCVALKIIGCELSHVTSPISNDDGDVSENNKNNDSAPASCFFVHFFAVTARLRRENIYLISRFVEDVAEHRTTNFFSFC